MGYAATKLRTGFTPTGANFINVSGGTTLHIGDLKVVGYEDGCSDVIWAQKLDVSGDTQDGKIWVWADLDDDEEDLHLHGWYDIDGDEPVNVDNTIEIGLGEGVWIDCQDDTFEYSIQCSGQVYDQTLPVQLRQGFTLVANPCPCDLKIGNVIVSGYEDGCSDVIWAQKLDISGDTQNGKIWVWADLDDDEEDLHLHGWYDIDGDEPVNVDEAIPLALGESLWIDCQDDSVEYFVTFPTAIK